MKIAGHTMGTPEYTLERAITLFSDLGFDGIEIIWDDSYSCALPKKTNPKTIKEVRTRIKNLNLDISCLTPYMTEINSLNNEELHRDLNDFMRCIEVAGELECQCIRVYGGSYFEEKERHIRQEKEKRLIESLAKMGEKAVKYGVVLAVETHFNTLTCTAKETSEIIRKVDHPHVKVLYDQPNLGFVRAEEYKEAIELLDGIIGMVHVKDFIFKENVDRVFRASHVMKADESERTVMSKIPGEGILPWPEIIRMLKTHNYNGYLSLEYERRWHSNDLPPATDGMKKGLLYLRPLLEKLNDK